MKNKYTKKARKVKINGVLYDSWTEARMAKVLHRNRIIFEPHVCYPNLMHPNREKPFSYTIDFVLAKPSKFAGIPTLIQAIEVKGVLSNSDLDRLEALEFYYGIKGWLVSEFLIKFWEVEGLWRQRSETYLVLLGGD